MILDLGLPDLDGVAVIEGLRGCTAPVIVLSARDEERAKVHALDAGADDYVTKPFGMEELLARLRAAVRRTAPSASTAAVTTEAFTVDLAARRVMAGQDEIRLTPTEWHLLETLVRYAGKLLTQRQLLQQVWGPSYGTETNYLRVHISPTCAASWNRIPVAPLPDHRAGIGYRFMPGSDDRSQRKHRGRSVSGAI